MCWHFIVRRENIVVIIKWALCRPTHIWINIQFFSFSKHHRKHIRKEIKNYDRHSRAMLNALLQIWKLKAINSHLVWVFHFHCSSLCCCSVEPRRSARDIFMNERAHSECNLIFQPRLSGEGSWVKTFAFLQQNIFQPNNVAGRQIIYKSFTGTTHTAQNNLQFTLNISTTCGDNKRQP